MPQHFRLERKRACHMWSTADFGDIQTSATTMNSSEFVNVFVFVAVVSFVCYSKYYEPKEIFLFFCWWFWTSIVPRALSKWHWLELKNSSEGIKWWSIMNQIGWRISTNISAMKREGKTWLFQSSCKSYFVKILCLCHTTTTDSVLYLLSAKKDQKRPLGQWKLWMVL